MSWLESHFNTRKPVIAMCHLRALPGDPGYDPAGAETPSETLKLVKDAVPATPVFANTGVNLDNLGETLNIADGAITGTAFKRAGHIWNEVDVERVRDFMRIARAVRGG